MTEATLLTEIALNERPVTHPEYGSFIVKRSTFSIEAQVDGARARQMNADLQARQSVEDSDGMNIEVPAYLTRKSRADQLVFHGLWGDKHEQELEAASDKYRAIVLEMELSGYEGATALANALVDIRAKLSTQMEGKCETEINIVAPTFGYTTEPASAEDYNAACAVIKKEGKSLVVDELIAAASPLHKLYELFSEGVRAQTELIALKINEINLFSETIESRTDRAGQVAKVFYCTVTTEHKQVWKNTAELMSEESGKVKWLLSEIEKFERLEEAISPEEVDRRDRFNFLAHLRVGIPDFASSPAVEESKVSGDSAEETSSSSTKSSESSKGS